MGGRSDSLTTPLSALVHGGMSPPWLDLAMIMSEKIEPTEPESTAAANPSEQVPDWLSNRLRRMFTEVMDEPVPEEFKALLRKLEEKERGS